MFIHPVILIIAGIVLALGAFAIESQYKENVRTQQHLDLARKRNENKDVVILRLENEVAHLTTELAATPTTKTFDGYADQALALVNGHDRPSTQQPELPGMGLTLVRGEGK